MRKGYVIAHVGVNDPEAFRSYVENNGEVVARHGGQFIIKAGKAEVQEGQAFETHIVVEFPSLERARAFYNDPVYQEIAQFRKDAGESVLILCEGVDVP